MDLGITYSYHIIVRKKITIWQCHDIGLKPVSSLSSSSSSFKPFKLLFFSSLFSLSASATMTIVFFLSMKNDFFSERAILQNWPYIIIILIMPARDSPGRLIKELYESIRVCHWTWDTSLQSISQIWTTWICFLIKELYKSTTVCHWIWDNSNNCQFHQHFTGAFCANICTPKKLQSQNVTREKLCRALSYKFALKMLIKLTPSHVYDKDYDFYR